MKKQKITLIEVILAEEKNYESLLQVWCKQHKIKIKKTGDKQYKVLNGPIKNIMFYPTKMKVMFQTSKRNYVITSEIEDNVIGLLKGNIAFCKMEELC